MEIFAIGVIGLLGAILIVLVKIERDLKQEITIEQEIEIEEVDE